jgi:hypothetical protein
MAVPQPSVPTTALGPCGGTQPPGARYGGWMGPFPPSRSASSSQSQEQLGSAMDHDPMPPKFYKLEFTTYNGSVDPLNWLNHCEQFFCNQMTLASNRTWLASYHLWGVAKHGTTPSSKTSGCRCGSASRSYAICSLGHLFEIRAFTTTLFSIFGGLCYFRRSGLDRRK